MDTNALTGRAWQHSHEEDSGDEMIFRPTEVKLPPSRGRAGYRFAPDGTATLTGPSPDDRSSQKTGSWRLTSADAVELSVPGEDTRTLRIASISPDKLVIRRGPNAEDGDPRA